MADGDGQAKAAPKAKEPAATKKAAPKKAAATTKGKKKATADENTGPEDSDIDMPDVRGRPSSDSADDEPVPSRKKAAAAAPKNATDQYQKVLIISRCAR